MSEEHRRADEILARKQGANTTQRWGHSNPEDDDILGAHWSSNSRRSKSHSNKYDTTDKIHVELCSPAQQARDSENLAPRDRSDRPRNKNRRPDVAVYVPRARRPQQSGELTDSPSVAAQHDTSSKQRRQKAVAEVYVPRAKRLQNQSGDVSHERGLITEDRLVSNDHSETSAANATKSNKEPQKEKKHRRKEGVKVQSDKSSDSERKDLRKKHKHKSKKDKEKDHAGEGDSFTQEYTNSATGEEGHSDDVLALVDTNEGCVDENTTWEEEMNFYDSVNVDPDNSGAMETESHSSHNQQESESALEKDTMCLEKDPDLENSPVLEFQEQIQTEAEASEGNLGSSGESLEESKRLDTAMEATSGTAITNDALTSDVPKVVEQEDFDQIEDTGDRPSKRIKSSDEGEIETVCDSPHLKAEIVTQNSGAPIERVVGHNSDEVIEAEDAMIERESSGPSNQEFLTDIGADEHDTVVGVTANIFQDIPEEDMKAEAKTPDAAKNVELKETEALSDDGVTKSDETTMKVDSSEDKVLIDNAMTNTAPAPQSKRNTEAVREALKIESTETKVLGDVVAVSERNAEATEQVEDEDSWDALYTDDGEALDPKLMEELTAAVGKVEIEKPQFDYYNYQPKDPDLDDPSFDHLIEIYDFPKELITRDLLAAFREYKDRGFDIKWVDDNHAIGIFSSAIAAQAVLGMKHPLMKVRPISQASRPTKLKAKKCATFLEPYRARPETTAAVARSLVTGALGLKSTLTREQRDEERKKLKEAKEKRRQERQQKKDAWDGSYGKCAMDM